MTGANPRSTFDSTLSNRMVADTTPSGSGDSTKEASHSLWQEVYENPGKTALAAGCAVLAVGAVIASRGALAKLWPEAKAEVLLVEDSPYFGKAIKDTLERQGNKVTWLSGAEDATALNRGVALGPDGKAVEVHLDRFKAAFVDGDLAGKVTGSQVVDRLTAEHVASVGISTQPAMNNEMLQHGAIAAGMKPSVFGALFRNELTVANVLKEPGTVQGRIDGYQAAYLKDHSIAEGAEAMLKAVMKEKGIG